MSEFRSLMKQRFNELSVSERKIINEVWEHRTQYIQWPAKARLLWPGCVRTRYHKIPDKIIEEARSKGVQIDARSNGPAIMSFLLAGGKRPKRSNNQGWHIDHIYDGKFPWTIERQTLHAVKDGNHFTQSAGLIAIHPIAEALRDEYFYFAWLLRREAFVRFNYDPDIVFCKKIDERGFCIVQKGVSIGSSTGAPLDERKKGIFDSSVTPTTKDELFREHIVQETVVRQLKKRGYVVLEKCVDNPADYEDITLCRTSTVFGIDIVAQKNREKWIIEVKGETKGGTAAGDVDLMSGIRQLLTYMKAENGELHYGIAIPNTPHFANALKKLRGSVAIKKLNLHLFLVEMDGTVNLIGPDKFYQTVQKSARQAVQKLICCLVSLCQEEPFGL